MKIWDLRSDSKEPNSTFMLSGDQVTPTCLTFHPTQRHLILAGDDLGEHIFIVILKTYFLYYISFYFFNTF